MLDKSDLRLMHSLCDLHKWNWSDHPVVNSLVGRHIYLSLSKDFYASQLGLVGPQSLKQVLFDGVYTERAIRLKLDEFERSNLIIRRQNEGDRRCRAAQPTDKFLELVGRHVAYCKSKLGSNFIFVGDVNH
jgi:hypothetical protein